MIITLFCHSTNLLNIETLNLSGTHTHTHTELNPLSFFTVLLLSISGNRRGKHTKRFHWDKNYIPTIMSNFAWSFKIVVCYQVQACTAPQHDRSINQERTCRGKELRPCSESSETQMMDSCPKESSYLCRNSGFFYPKRGGGSCCLLQTSGCWNSLFLQLSIRCGHHVPIDKTIVIFWSAAFYLSMNGSVLPLKVKPVGQCHHAYFRLQARFFCRGAQLEWQ